MFDPTNNELKFANAGLPYPVLVSNTGVSELALGGIPSGMFAGTSYEQQVVRLSPGDVVLFATDGLHEMRNQSGDDFAWKYLPETWSNCAQKSADESLDILFEGVKHFSPESVQNDDITAVALKVPDPSEKKVSIAGDDAAHRVLSEVSSAGPSQARRNH
jgi:serine phosphatase RsbU (regulator of sigma subunit)